MSKSTLTPMDPLGEQFAKWLQTPGFRAPVGTCLHHTWSPTAEQYEGRSSIVAIRNYHVNSNGWSDIAAQGYACPDGQVFTARPLDAANWCHAYMYRGANSEPELLAAARKYCPSEPYMFPNRLLFGLETVACFDYERPEGDGLAAHSYECAMRVLTTVHRVFNLPAEMLFFHRDAENKSCPGTLLNRAAVRSDLAARLGGSVPSVGRDLKVVLDGIVVDCKPLWVGDSVTVEAAPLLAELGFPTTNPAVHENGRAYLRTQPDGSPGLDQFVHPYEFFFRQPTQGDRIYVKQVAGVVFPVDAP